MGNYGKKKKSGRYLPIICLLLVWIVVLGIIFIAADIRDSGHNRPKDTMSDDTGRPSISTNETEPHSDSSGTETISTETDPPETQPEPVTFTESTIVSAGDLIFHMAQINYAHAVAGDGYDFSNSFKYIKDIISSADFAVANFETTLAGADKEYSGYPSFNAPDSTLTAIKDAGFDMMLFANNHCYDKGLDGFMRTQDQFTKAKLAYIGAKKSTDSKAYAVVDVGGIKVGMINYADDLSSGKDEKRTINGKTIKNDDYKYMNIYNPTTLDSLYSEIADVIDDCRDEGADIIIAYMHWGSEYNIKHGSSQTKVAQALCDLGVDIIIGGHPHVIQDVEILTDSNDPDRSVLCFYSLGNLVSNQNRSTLGDTKNSTYTEGGLIVSLTLRKYSTGETFISYVDTIPTFVHRHKAKNGYYVHEIVPLEYAIASPDKYGLDDSSFGEKNAEEVYKLETDVLAGITEAYNQSIALPVID